MTELRCEAEVELDHLPAYLDKIEDRLQSFQAVASRSKERVEFAFPFGDGRFDMKPGRLVMSARSGDRDGLARIKDLLATAVNVYAREEAPSIRWRGDCCDDTALPQFREMTVGEIRDLTPRMKRVRLLGSDLGRFAKFGGMHIRMLFPTPDLSDPVWPTLGENGLALWPPAQLRPTPRAYTVRKLDVAAGWMDVDILIHDGDSVGSRWAVSVRQGMKVGIMGPVGRPVRLDAQWYLLGADETGLPAVARLLETLDPATRGIAFIEVADESERQQIDNRTMIDLRWIVRNEVPAGRDDRLAQAVLAVEWPSDCTTFGWFAAEAQAASIVRDHWRGAMGLGRDRTLAATYWRSGTSGFMAG